MSRVGNKPDPMKESVEIEIIGGPHCGRELRAQVEDLMYGAGDTVNIASINPTTRAVTFVKLADPRGYTIVPAIHPQTRWVLRYTMGGRR